MAVRRRWLLGVTFAVLAMLGVLSLLFVSPAPNEAPPLPFPTLELRARPAKIVSTLGVPFELRVEETVNAPARIAGGEWRTDFDEEVVPEWLRNDPSKGLDDLHPPAWTRAFVCIRPGSGHITVSVRLTWRPPGGSGFTDKDTGEKAAVAIPVRCEGPDAPRCGDGLVTHDEQCDSTELLEYQLRQRQKDGFSVKSLCTLLRKGTGTLRCASNCRYDVSGCFVPASCGNGILDRDEACDGKALGGASCGSLGFSAGELRCREDCQLDASGCYIILL